MYKKEDLLYHCPILGAYINSAFGVTVATGALAGAASGAIMTGTLSGTLKGAAFGAISAGVAFGIGEQFGHAGSIFGKNVKAGQAFIKATAHGLSRGVVSMAQGGTFKSGFASGFSSSFFSPGTELGGDGAGGFTLRTTIAGVVGGTASEIGGGKFANGAVSGAFVHMFNAEVTKVVNGFRRSPKWKYAKRLHEGAKAVAIKAKHLRVELKTFGGGLDTYKALITKTWDYPALSGETTTVLSPHPKP